MDENFDPAGLDPSELYQLTRMLLRKYAITPRATLGQNFVVDSHLIRTLLTVANLSKEDTVLEVGPGLGITTQALALRAKQVIAIEKDPLLATSAQVELIKQDNVEVIHGDALDVSLPKAQVFISNLPFEISTPLTLRILASESFERFIVSYQKEYALRACAVPSSANYGRLSVKLSYYGDFQIVKTFPPRSFFPSPKVAVSIVKTDLKIPSSLIKTETFDWLLITIFSRKHKKLRNTLLRSIRKQKVPPTIEIYEDYKNIKKLDLMDKRAIQLTPDEILMLAITLFEK